MTAAPLAEPVLCSFCGEPELVELFEMWGHEFMWETCCESLHHSLVEEVNADPAWGVSCCAGLARRLTLDTGCAAWPTMADAACCWTGSWTCARSRSRRPGASSGDTTHIVGCRRRGDLVKQSSMAKRWLAS